MFMEIDTDNLFTFFKIIRNGLLWFNDGPLGLLYLSNYNTDQGAYKKINDRHRFTLL